MDPTTKEKLIYTRADDLNEGGYGKAGLFSCKERPGKPLVVKKLLERFDTSYDSQEIYDHAVRCNNEMKFMQAMNPDLMPYRLKYSYNRFSNRHHTVFVMPQIPGTHVLDVIPTLTQPEHFVYLLLAIALKLKSIHEMNIVHSDVKSSNILVVTTYLKNSELPLFKIYFIDCGVTNYVGAKVAGFSDYSPCYIAPERFTVNDRNPTAQFSQDTYSFAHLVLSAYNKNKTKFPAFKFKYTMLCNFLFDFYTDSNNELPGKRPTLQFFIDNVTSMLATLTETSGADLHNSLATTSFTALH